MTRHPIYKDPSYAAAFEAYKRNKDKFEAISLDIGGETIGLMLHIKTMERISKEGHVLIDIENDKWESDISKKTIGTMAMSDIKFPFMSGAVIDKESDDGVIFFSIDSTYFNISFGIKEADEGGMLFQRILLEKTVSEGLSHFDTHIDETYRVLSALMYISAFKKNKSRVTERVGRKLKASKKRHVPNHKIHTVLVRQPEGTRHGATGGGKSSVCWLVKGHWRNQWYASTGEHKTKWIDPYFKGRGKEEIDKVYVIGNTKQQHKGE